MKYIQIIIVTLLLVAGALFLPKGLTGNVILEKTEMISEPVYESGKDVEVYFCPEDDCMDVLINLSLKAEESIYCAFYDLELTELISALNRSDIDFRMVQDDHNFESNRELFFGMEEYIHVDSSSALMHDKFCVFDGKVIATGSFNPTERGNYHNNNNLVVMGSKYLAGNYLEEFEELWDGQRRGPKVRHPIVFYNDNKIENYFCPEDCSPDIYVDLIDSAEISVYFMTFSFTRDDIGDALVRANLRGVTVEGVFEKSQNNQWLEKTKLEDEGINVKWDKNPANMHHKVFIIDGKILITGSTNPSNNGLTRNDENILILHDKDVADEFMDEFNAIW